MTDAWSHDWRTFTYEKLRGRGISSVLEYVRNAEATPYEDLASDLGGSQLAPIQIQKLLREEISDDIDIEYYMRTSLVRYLRYHVPQGIRMHGDWNLTLAFGSWAGGMDESMQSRCTKIVKKLKKAFSICADDWIPLSANDSIIVNVFDEVPAS
ncbi:hypothetical protein Enr10x_04630 [Gimesia panareensis]|uniref:Uncharacterized protein n=1 Tax=Gimesia panareensis TaxID=2527978 RepID=A0A517Q0K6_9PLAN|nr:hypothetical protein [Gimesia panareensis]QDT25168.1 hypothetical protein Enr10x_04630 [Gimesia panareensis]